jgi:hypothetical protein
MADERMMVQLPAADAARVRKLATQQRRSLSGVLAILIQGALEHDELTAAAREARALGLDPVAAIRERLGAEATLTR